jgi:pimeloyl-ACP methyl ester carboxylesterase
VYALDLPGHGRSDPPGRSDVDRYAQDVLDFSQALGLKRVVLAGYSMGGAIDLAIALRQPAFLDGLILVGSGARLPVTSLILDGLRTDFSGTVQLIAKFACGTASPPHLKQQVVQRMLDNPPEVVLGDYLACNTFDVRERLAEIRLPTLIIGASHDKMMPPKFSFFLHERIPQSQLVIVEDAGHTMALEKTAEVTAEIVKFLDGSKSGSR